MQVDIPEDMITHIEDSEELSRMVLVWNTFDAESLKEYFEHGGKPYAAFSKDILYSPYLYDVIVNNLWINSSGQKTIMVPLPSLMVRQHFVQDDKTYDIKAMQAYNKMLDMCLEHGLGIDACDSLGLSMLHHSLAHFSAFSCILSEQNNDWSNTKVRYSSEFFDYSVVGILLNRGADPFRSIGDREYTNALCLAADGACNAADMMRCVKTNPGKWRRDDSNLFYTDVLAKICRDAPYFESSPCSIYEQYRIASRLIQGGMLQSKSGGVPSDIFVSALNTLLEKRITAEEILEPDNYDSILYCLCRDASEAIKVIASWNIPNGSDQHREYIKSRYNAVQDYFRQVLTLLQSHGADIEFIEHIGKLSVSGLFAPAPGLRQSYSKEYYAYLRDLETILVQYGWDPDVKDKHDKTLFDYYPNKREGQKALKLLQKIHYQLEAEKAAYASADIDFMR